MSVITSKSRLSSILKNYSPGERDKAKSAVVNKVRFELPKELGISGAINAVLNDQNYLIYREFISFIKESSLDDSDLLRIIRDAKISTHLLKPTFTELVETLLTVDWIDRNEIIIKEFSEFYVNLINTHNKYAGFGVSKLIAYWIPNEKDESRWESDGSPTDVMKQRLCVVHGILASLLNSIPLIYDVVLDAIETLFPYYKKPAIVLAGYIHNVLWLLEYKPMFSNHMITLIFKRVLVIDVNAPRNEIEDAEFEEDDDETMFEVDLDENREKDEKSMMHPIAETLDVCMGKLFEFLQSRAVPENSSATSPAINSDATDLNRWFKVFLDAFDHLILPSHNTHHIQFLIFYFCSLKTYLADHFLNYLWRKIIDPNNPPPLRQSSTGYLASFLARSKSVPIGTLKKYLAEMCSWAHQYIQRSDCVRSNCALKANIVFFSVCQSIFYIIAFRSRDLTNDKKSLLFLQSLQLSTLVTSNFNPLRVCLPAVATAFAGVTRAHQLAYCHTILERNARRKLATVYANDTVMPEDILETFFPFDPFILKKSGKHISPIYLQYQASEAEEDNSQRSNAESDSEAHARRKRDDSVMEDVDDFITDKRQKLNELAKSLDKELQFTYGLSPGFHY